MKSLHLLEQVSDDEIVLCLFIDNEKTLEETHIRRVDNEGYFMWDGECNCILKKVGDRIGFHLIISRLLMGEKSVQF